MGSFPQRLTRAVLSTPAPAPNAMMMFADDVVASAPFICMRVCERIYVLVYV